MYTTNNCSRNIFSTLWWYLSIPMSIEREGTYYPEYNYHNKILVILKCVGIAQNKFEYNRMERGSEKSKNMVKNGITLELCAGIVDKVSGT